MYPTHCDKIQEGDNVIVALGDSFTQGVGAYSLETWKSISDKNPSTYNISGQYFVEEQGKNNWARQLQQTFLPDYKVWNLAVNGAGNRAAVKELYLNPLPANLSNVVVILMATGTERFDFLKQKDDTAGFNCHQKWQTIWPAVMKDRGEVGKIEEYYFHTIWSYRNDALEFLMNVKEAETFCKSQRYTFLFGSAFEERISKTLVEQDLDDRGHLVNMVDWSKFMSVTNRKSFMDYINQLENPEMPMHQIFSHTRKLAMPTKYITPCGHWTVEGSGKVAEYIYNELKNRELV